MPAQAPQLHTAVVTMKNLASASLLVSTLLTTSLLGACATEEPSGDFEVTLQSGDGKFDGLDGRKIRFHNIDFEVPWIEDDGSKLGRLRELSVDVATNDIAIVSSTNITFAGSINETIGSSPWRNGKILELSAIPEEGHATALAFVLAYSTNRFHTEGTQFSQLVECTRDGATYNVFQTVAIDVVYREIHSGDTTFTFEQCGITRKDVEMDFDITTLPIATEGAFAGKTKYRISAVLK